MVSNLLVFSIFLESTSFVIAQYTEFYVDENTNPFQLASSTCENKHLNCMAIGVPAIELFKARNFNATLKNWKFNEFCNCDMPPRPEKLPFIQFVHIPKSGSSINRFFHDYYDCSYNREDENPCSGFVNKVESKDDLLCGGKLLTCAGHVVSPTLPNVITNDFAFLVTLIRHPWNRLQSDYYYLKSKPHSQHHGPYIDVSHLLSIVKNVYEFSAYPGISNCATKMLNGFQCPDRDIVLEDRHLEIAKKVLLSVLWFGITERFSESICLFSWMYGGTPNESHVLNVFRKGSYKYETLEESLNEMEIRSFNHRERFDLALYEYATEVFDNRWSMTGCK